MEVLLNRFALLRDAREQGNGTGRQKATHPDAVPVVKVPQAGSRALCGFRRLWRRLRPAWH